VSHRLGSRHFGPVFAALEFNWQDIWIGVYAKRQFWEGWSKRQVIYVTIIPMLPIMLDWEVDSALR